MRAAVLSIGSELLHGFLTDTNATFLTQELTALGIEVTGVFQVGDDLQRIVTDFRRALSDADVVIASGGIGPTEDDLTREAVAVIRDEAVQVNEDLALGIRQYFAMRGISMPEQNVKQAWLIPSADALPNPIGTAPGWFVRHNDQVIIVMPGVPREMYRMWREQVLPRLVERLDGNVVVSRTLKTIGIGESALEREIIDVVHRGSPVVATYAKDDGVHIRITAVRDNSAEAEALVTNAEQEIRQHVGNYVYGYLDDSLASAILRPIAESGQQISISEAGNGGRLAAILEESRLADAVVAVAVTTSYQTAVRRLGVADDPAAVSAACATEVAEQTGTGFAAGVAVRIVGGAAPDRAQASVGLALVYPGGNATREHTIATNSAEIRRRATMWACDFLWSTIRDATHGRMG